VPEMEAGGVDVGDPATLHVQALPSVEISAKVTRTSWSLDPANRSLRAEIDVANEESRLRPGMYATAMIELAHRENALTLPATAIVRDGNATYCYSVENGTAKRRSVQLGIRSGPDFEVIGGLDGQQSVVLLHPETLIDGQPVAIESPNK
jgi:RND family efflux transporter MFP subunit